MQEFAASSYIYMTMGRAYPISHDDDQQYTWVTKRAFNKNRVSIHQCQSETPWYNQTHDCYQVAVLSGSESVRD